MTPAVAAPLAQRRDMAEGLSGPLYDLPARVLSIHSPALSLGMCRCGHRWPCEPFVLAMAEVSEL